ncbi:HmuY family protein [Sphingobacterium sp. lm-10]|uniref:HmuY family protein n=1 Tax=Sphingobacterium sp. lm-10 TaxID=2944904 RepID=UPI002021997F|nr:HmuY family protein [Sphingobacterium sp. lm-10]MCL7988930.1 HmuY family protein [Sphingobacterium sp. lm-10]
MKITPFKTTLLCGLLIATTSCSREDTLPPEIPPSEGTQLTLQGGEGGANAVNAVYVDLSTDTQVPVARNAWNLGFHAGNEFRVIVNNQMSAGALATTFTDLQAVSSANVDINQFVTDQSAPNPAHFELFDDTIGRITYTAIAEISTNPTENQVYVINPQVGTSVNADNLWKVRVQRSGNAGYTMQYAPLNSNDIQTATINKDAAYNFQFFSFTQGPVQIEPVRAQWDFVWSASSYYTNFRGVMVPYSFSDIIFINHLAGAQAAEVIVGQNNFNIAYTDFNESHLNQVQLINHRNVIGSTWRATTGNPIGAFNNRYYILRDSANNIYKIRFNGMGSGNDGADRGYPQLEYQLVRRG